MKQHTLLTANGCRVDKEQITDDFGMFLCCNIHDVCLQLCGSKPAYCAEVLSDCAGKICSSLEETRSQCQEQAKTFVDHAKNIKIDAVLDKQQKSCDCLRMRPLRDSTST